MKIRSISLAVANAFGLVLGGLALEVDKDGHGKLPEGVRGLYKEHEGKYKLDVDGVEDVTGLKNALKEERDRARGKEKAEKDLASLREQLKSFDGIDPAKYKSIMDKLGSEEEATLIKEGKLDQVFELRTAKLREKHIKDLESAGMEREGALEVARSLMDRVLDFHVTEAAIKAGVHAAALDDIKLRARGLFQLGDDLAPVQFDGEGDDAKPVLGKDGKTPFSLGEWLDDMKEKAPHWYPNGNTGGGARGGGAAGGGKQIKRAAFEALGPDEKMAKIKEGYKVAD